MNPSPNSDSPRRPLVGVIDDEPAMRRIARTALERAGYSVEEGANGREAVELARSGRLDAMILDVRMPEMTGIEALKAIRAENSAFPIILLTAYIDVRDAVDAIKSGAQDYLEKPIDLDELVVAVDEAVGTARQGLPRAGAEAFALPPDVVAESTAMRAVFGEAARVAPTDVTVLLLGESGSGKEVLARFIHEHSSRADKRFVAVNCAALPDTLIESELFGHERGAFTGAVSQKAGRFEEADGGTLLLDEIGDMPLELQPKLLRALEQQEIRRVGGTRDIRVNVRVIAATNRPLEDDARAGRFREDLLYRLNVIALRIPPLRERREDIPPLARNFLKKEGKGDKRLSPAALRLLERYSWPGNVRELRNAALRAAILSSGALILPEDLPETLRREPTASAGSSSAGVLVGDMEEIQKRAILEALDKTNGNKTEAAKIPGISRRNLIYKLRSWGM